MNYLTCGDKNKSKIVSNNYGTEVTSVDDISVSDVIIQYNSSGGYTHTMFVGEIDSDGSITVYDGGSYFIKSGGNYKRTNMNDSLKSGLASGKYRIFHVSDLDGTSSRSSYVYDPDDDNNEYTSGTLAEWFQTDDEELYEAYLVKMIRAQIASMYPKLGDYEGNDGTEDSQGNKKDDDGDYVAQGIVEIQRTTIDENGNTGSATTLTYLPYDSLSSLIASGDSSALNYFSFDSSSGLIYYATYSKTIVTENGTEISSIYTLKENSASYSSLVEMASMPYNFLYALLQTTDNPEYVMAVADLVFEESEVVLMIQDQLSITEYTVDEYKAKKTTTQDVTEAWDTFDIEHQYDGYWKYGDVETEYDFPEESTLKETITTIYTNTANVYIQKANTWCIDFEQSATINTSVSEGEAVITEYSDDDYAELSYTLTFSNRSGMPSLPTDEISSYRITEEYLSDSYLTYSNKTDTINYTASTSISTEKQINTDKFLGLWKNDTGEYYLGCTYDEDGKVVYYDTPEVTGTLSPVEALSADNDGEGIDLVLDLLELHSDTQVHEQLMMYYWNVYFGEDVYEVDLDELLNLFSTTAFTSYSNNGAISYSSLNLTDSDLQILYKIVSAERGGGTQEQQQYVASVVLNRVLSSSFPNTVYDVVFQTNQFEPTSNGAYDRANPSQTTVDAVNYVVQNGDTTGGAVYFMTPAASLSQSWLSNCIFLFNDEDDSLQNTNTSGTHNFYTTQAILDELEQYKSYSSSTIVASAIEVHEYVRTNGYTYAQAGITVPNYTSKTIDCSSFVTWVLVNAGVNGFSEGMYQWTSSTFYNNSQGWQEVSVSDAQPGDILVYSGHVEIVAETGTNSKFIVYNCGGDDSIKASGSSSLPESSTSGHTKNKVLKVLRVS